MQRNDKILCKLLNYIPNERTFEVEDIASKMRGYVIFLNNYQDISILKEAYNKKRNIALYFDKYECGKALFSYKKLEFIEDKQVEVKALFSEYDKDFNLSLFENLYNSLGEVIDSEEKFFLAKSLLLVNKELKIKKSLTKELFKMSTSTFQKKFWNEGLLPFFSNIGIRELWSGADEEKQATILQRLGIRIQPISITNVECYFDQIGEVVAKNIISAKKIIKIAMAWFTNFNIFKIIKHKLENGVEVVLVTNNDLINNGGYCLNLNELIEKGLKIYLYEYPDMLHHKFCIIDDEIVMTGSYNWTFFSEAVNRENMIVIKDDKKIIESFTKEFQYIIRGRQIISKMPSVVPERPEYDRSSFKQYISEELVIRARKRIGDIYGNISRAKSLSPSYITVSKAIQDLDINLSDTSISTQSLDFAAETTAIEERRKLIDSNMQKIQKLEIKQQTIQKQQKDINKRHQEVQAYAQRIVENKDITEEERKRKQKDISQKKESLQREEELLKKSLDKVEEETINLNRDVQQSKDEIRTIQETSQVETQGGRGSLKINLKWNTIDDLDLHVFDPDGYEIYYNSRNHVCNGVKGQLDIDANASTPYSRTPQENIYWEEGKNAPIGRYKVQVVLYSKRDIVDNIPFTITVYPDKGETKIFPGEIKTLQTPKTIIEFEYSENGIIYL